MYKYATLLIGLSALLSCGKKVKDINVDEDIETRDFITAFSERSLPIQFTQQDLEQQEKDSFFIKPSIVSRFVPDSLFKQKLGSIKQAKFYHKGRYTAEETKETYLFLVAEKQEKKQVYVLCFDKKDQYSTGMLLVEKTNNPLVSIEGSMDKRLTIIRNTSKVTREGKSFYNKSAYVYNTAGLFTLILTESNEPVAEKEIFNPIDTLPRKDPLSRNYMQNKRNFVAVRDGVKKGKLQFFIHIEKQGGNCMGRLRGDMTEVKPRVYHYNKADDHCVIEFNFSGKSLMVRELEACGNHRGVKCSFNGRFSALQ